LIKDCSEAGARSLYCGAHNSLAYTIRNIIAHEAPKERQYTDSDVDDFFDAATELVQATQERLSFLLQGNYPLTQMKLNARAADVLKEAEVELDSILQSAQRSPEFQRTQGAWQEYAELQARFRSEIDKPGHGSMAPMLYYGFKTELIRLRIKELSPKPEGQW
jgi:Lysozyme inhibitor LprI